MTDAHETLVAEVETLVAEVERLRTSERRHVIDRDALLAKRDAMRAVVEAARAAVVVFTEGEGGDASACLEVLRELRERLITLDTVLEELDCPPCGPPCGCGETTPKETT